MDQYAVPPPLPPLPGNSPAPELLPPLIRPWGVWSTIGWTLVIAFTFVMAQGVVLVIWGAVSALAGSHGLPNMEELATSGLVTAVATICSAPVAVGLSVLFASLRKGLAVRDYLGLRWAGKRATASWLAVILVFGVLTDLVTTLIFGKELVPDVMVDIYRSAGIPALLWLAIIVAAPVAEEFIFRGFLLTGLLGVNSSRVREFIAIFAASLAWAAIHVQYDSYGVAVIFFAGLLLGYARTRTGSLWLCILMHMFMNLVATIEVELFMV